MLIPPNDQIERALLPFRIGRRLILRILLSTIVEEPRFVNPFLMLSRIFVRIKSADSIAEKIKRKGLAIDSADEIPAKMPDILGFRVITEDLNELEVFRDFLTSTFRVEVEQDSLTQASDFGQRGIEYSLRHESGGMSYPFELQLRTYLQHYWAAKSFHLFHKQAAGMAERHRGTLAALGEILYRAENLVLELKPSTSNTLTGSAPWEKLPIWDTVNLITVLSGEQFMARLIYPLSFKDEADHNAIVSSKTSLYSTNPGCAIVECSCLSFSTFLLNEPHVRVPMDRVASTHV